MKCKKCGKELELSGFENGEGDERVEFYACQTEGCPKRTEQIRVGWNDS